MSFLANRNVQIFNSTMSVSTLNTSAMAISTLTGSTLNASSINVSTLSGSTLTASTMTGNQITISTLMVSSINNGTPGVAAYSTFNASSINVTSTLTTSTLTTTSNVGIGTNPTQALHVQGSTIVSGAIGVGTTAPTDILNLGSGNIVLNNNAAQANGFLYNQNSIWGGVEVEGLAGTGAQTINMGVNTNRSKAWSSTYNGLWLRVDNRTSSTYNGFHFFNKAATSGNESELMTILSTGSIGIGSSSPGAQLQVTNNVASYTIPTVSISDGAADNGGAYGMINLTRPAAVTDNKAYVSLIRNGNYLINMGYYQGSNTFGFGTGTAGMATANCIMAFSGANVGIGITNPAQTLDVNGTIARNGLKLPRFDYGTVGPATSVSIPILFSDTQYNVVEIRFRYQVSAKTDINMSATSTTPATMTLGEVGLTTVKYNAQSAPDYNSNSSTTSFIFASSVEELGTGGNLMFRIVRSVGSGNVGQRNHYSYDNVYCWYGIGTARGYGQGHIDNTGVGGPALAYLNLICVTGNINGNWSTTHYN